MIIKLFDQNAEFVEEIEVDGEASPESIIHDGVEYCHGGASCYTEKVAE